MSSPVSPTRQQQKCGDGVSTGQQRKRPRCLNFDRVKHHGREETLGLLSKLLHQTTNSVPSGDNSLTSTSKSRLQSRRNHTVIIQAESGTGKTDFLEQFEREHLAKSSMQLLYAFGKFEERAAASEPFAVIVDIINELVDRILTRHDQTQNRPQGGSNHLSKLERKLAAGHTISRSNSNRENDPGIVWGKRIRMAIPNRGERMILLGILPSLKRLLAHRTRQSGASTGSKSITSSTIDEEDDEAFPNTTTTATSNKKNESGDNTAEACQNDDASSTSSTYSSSSIDWEEQGFGDMTEREWRFERFRIAFRELIRCISTHCPLVLIFDDLHYADQDSLALIKSVMNDNSLSVHDQRLLLICASRPETWKHLLGIPEENQYKFLVSQSSTGDATAETTTDDDDDAVLPYVVDLPKLTKAEILSLLTELLERSDDQDPVQDELDSLADLVTSKTGGNAFVVMHFLRRLEQKEFIHFSQETNRFELKPLEQIWSAFLLKGRCSETASLESSSVFSIDDSARSVASDTVAETVMEVLVDNLKQLDPEQRLILLTAASLGVSHFELSTIVHAVNVVQNEQENPSLEDDDHQDEYTDHFVVRQNMVHTRHSLESAVQGGLVQELKPGYFKFSHDRIREAAYSLLPRGSEERTRMHLKIGRQFRLWMDTEREFGTSLTDDSFLLHAAKQLDLGKDLISDPWERLDVSELNFQAAQAAAKKNSFFPAMEYLHNGIEILGENAWKEHYKLTLKLKVALTRTQYSCGLYDSCLQTADDVIRHTGKFDDKRYVYHSKLLCLLNQEKPSEGIDLCLEILNGFGQAMPKRFLVFHLMREYFKVRQYMNTMTDEDIRKIPEITDQSLENSMGIMNRIGELSYYSEGQSMYLHFSILRMLSFMIEKGHNPHWTPVGLGIFGWFKVMENDFAGALRFGKLGVEFSDRLCSKHPGIAGRTTTLVPFWLFCWQEPIHETILPITTGAKLMWDSGALDTYFQDGPAVMRQKFLCGFPLDMVSSEAQKFLERLQDYNQKFHWSVNAPLAQAALNLMSRERGTDRKNSDNMKSIAALSGDIMDGKTSLIQWKATRNKAAVYQLQLYSMIVAYHFRDFQRAAKFQKDMRDDLFEDGPDFSVPMRVLYTGLIYIGRFRETQKWKYKSRAKSALNQIQLWTQNGARNCAYMKHLLEAELMSATMASTTDCSTILSLYDSAIEAAATTGIRQHEALSNELAFEFLTRVNSSGTGKAMNTQKLDYLLRSIRLYNDWCAFAIVQELESRHAEDLRTADRTLERGRVGGSA